MCDGRVHACTAVRGPHPNDQTCLPDGAEARADQTSRVAPSTIGSLPVAAAARRRVRSRAGVRGRLLLAAPARQNGAAIEGAAELSRATLGCGDRAVTADVHLDEHLQDK